MAGDFGILSQDPCGPPCFQGIQPGVTTFDEAALILKNAGFPCSVEDRWQGKFLVCGSDDAQIKLADSGFCSFVSTEPMVATIALMPPDKITVDEFIAAYGQPDLVMTWPQFALAYQDLQAFVFFSMEPGQKTYTFAPDSPIWQIIYVNAAEYQPCREMTPSDEQQWKGYGTYKEIW